MVSLRRNLGDEGLVGGVRGVGKDRVLLQKDPILVARVVERVLRIHSAPPDPQIVHVGGGRRRDEAAQPFGRLEGFELIRWDPVRALCENANPVDKVPVLKVQ